MGPLAAGRRRPALGLPSLLETNGSPARRCASEREPHAPRCLPACPQPGHAAELRAETVQAFEQYADRAGRRIRGVALQGELPFLWSMESATRAAILERGDIAVEPAWEADSQAIPGGLVHDWTAAVLIPVTDLERVVGIVTAYDTHATT